MSEYTELREYGTEEIDIPHALASRNKYGSFVTLDKIKGVYRVSKLDRYTRSDGTVGLIAEVAGWGTRDLREFKTIIIRN
jgi:hypothetical protein